MTPKFATDQTLFDCITNICDDPVIRPVILELSKTDCYQIHRYISTEYDCVCEDLTWKNDLIFNTETFTYKDMYDNLFKLKFKGVQLGQQ